VQNLIIALIGAVTGSGVSGIVIALLQHKWKKNDQQGAIMEKLESIDSRMDKMEAEDAEREAKHARIRILRFGDECSHEVRHSREHFEQVIEDVDSYETYCRDHPNFRNNKAVLTIKLIKDTYQQRLLNNDFI
jgi:hypothetical protein